MTEAPWLSVIIPTYNGAAYVGQALDSIAVQDADDIEVIAVDDGSTDETLAILASYTDRLPLRIVEHGRVANWVAVTNKGLEMASGRYVTMLHQDDLWLPGRLGMVRRHLVNRPQDILLVHPVWFIDGEGRRVGRWRPPLPAGVPLAPDVVLERLLVQDFISIPATTFPRALAIDRGGLDERLWYTADWDLWLRLAASAPTLSFPQTLAAVRVHGASITATWTTELDEFRWQHVTVLHRHLESWPADEARRRRVRAAGEFSVEVNVALAALAHRQRPSFTRLAARFARLGPGGLRRYFRDSRIVERAGARLRAGIGWRRRRNS